MVLDKHMSATQKWNRSIQFPTREDYKCRVLEALFGPSKKGNPMITFKFEIEAPGEVEIAGTNYTIAGQTFQYWLTTGVQVPEGASDDVLTGIAEKNENMKRSAEETLVAMGLDKESINWDNIDTKPLLGKLNFIDLYAEESEQRRDPTAAQIAEAKAKGVEPVGDIKKNPLTGEPLKFYNIKVRKIWGLVPGSSTVSQGF